MRETGEPSTWVQQCAVRSVVHAPPGIGMVAPPTTQRNASGAQCEGRAREGHPKSAAKGIVDAGVLHLASLQRGSLSSARIATTLLQRHPPWVITSLYPTASERRECMLALCSSSGYSQRWRW